MMPRTYDIYHDESKEDGYWHGFLFVPRDCRDDLLALLNEARTTTHYPHALHYVEIAEKTKWHHEKAIVAHAWTTIGIASLQQQKLRKFPPKVFLGSCPKRRRQATYRVLENLLKCKFVLFREKGNHKEMFSGLSKLQCIETTFRMGIKGGVHRLFSNEDPICIGNVFIDDDRQYIGEFGRTFDVNRTLMRFADEKQPFVSFLGNPKLIPQRSDHGLIDKEQDPADSHLLQLCDLLIGGFRFHAVCAKRNHIRYNLSLPCRELLSHEQKNAVRMRQSRYFNGFSLSEAWIENEEWQFAPMGPEDCPAVDTQPSLWTL